MNDVTTAPLTFAEIEADAGLLEMVTQAALFSHAYPSRSISMARRWTLFEAERGKLAMACVEFSPQAADTAAEVLARVAGQLLCFFDDLGQQPGVTFRAALEARQELSEYLELPHMSPINLNFLLSLHLAHAAAAYFQHNQEVFNRPRTPVPPELLSALADSLGICISLQKLFVLRAVAGPPSQA